MKRIKSFKIFEDGFHKIESVEMECEYILQELKDLGLSITVGHSSRWQIAITIKNGVSKLTDVYKTNVQTPIFEHLFSYLEEENYKKVYDQIESISYTEFVGPNNFPMERSERVHKLKFDDWNP
jgi:hypothetical protein